MSNIYGWFAVSAVISVAIATFTRQRGWGMALPVLAVGALFGMLPFGPDAPPNPEVVLVAILAPLVFGEALGSSYLDLRRVSKPVLALAVGLVLVTTAVIGGTIAVLIAAPLALPLALGAILAPTDAVAVSSVARRASLDPRLVSILEGESLVNDGTGLTLLSVAMAAFAAGTISIGQVSGILALSVIVGVAVGVAGGWLLARISAITEDTVAANGLILVSPFGLYLLAEHFHGSGILAVVVAALWVAHAQSADPERASRLQGVAVWRQVTFVLQALAFFLVGLEFVDTLRRLDAAGLRAVVAIVPLLVVLLIVTRMLFVLAMAGLSRVRGQGQGQGQRSLVWKGAIILGWAGTRGPVSGLAAFSIPAVLASGVPIPHRDVLLGVTFGVIVVTLLIAQTLAPLAKWLGATSSAVEQSQRRVTQALLYAALQRLDDIQEQGELLGEPYDVQALMQVRQELVSQLHEASGAGGPAADEQVSARHVRALKVAAVKAEQQELIRLRDELGLPDAVFRPMQQQLDVRMQALNGR